MDTLRILKRYSDHLNVNGNNVSLVCPFHADTQASLTVKVMKDTGLFYCFGCDWRGDIVDFVAKHEKMNRLQAMRFIKSMGEEIAVISNTNSAIVAAEDLNRQSLFKAYLDYKKHFSPDWNMKSYLQKRGLTANTLKALGVRYSMSNSYKFIIPIRENDKFAGWVKTDEGSTPKYLYNKGFKRAQVLWGSFSMNQIFVTEGVIDYMKAYQFGERNLVCLLGWKASAQQIQKMKGVADTVISALDNDEKGEEGTEYLKKHFNVIRFNFPKGLKDIGEMNKQQFNENRRN